MEQPAAKFECLACGHAEHRMSALGFGELVPKGCPRCGGDMAVAEVGLPEEWAEIGSLVGGHFGISDFIVTKNQMEFEVDSPDVKRSFRALLKKIRGRGYIAALRRRGEALRLIVTNFPKPPPGRLLINILLLLATIGTTFGFSYLLVFGCDALYASLFSCAILLMLGTHELGHKIAAWRNGVDASPPYFIPAPTSLGTLGAFIRVKSPIPTKEALVEMGASGPLFGFMAAIPLATVGLLFSKLDGEPLLFVPAMLAILQILTFGIISSSITLNPLIFSAWVMMVVTWLNLLPVGQLDGGHVARGLLSGEKHFQLTRILGFALVLSGFLTELLFLSMWGFLILFLFGHPHMGALDDVSELSRRHKRLGIAAFVVFLLCLPLPI